MESISIETSTILGDAESMDACGIGSCGVPRPSLGGYVTETRAESGVPAARER